MNYKSVGEISYIKLVKLGIFFILGYEGYSPKNVDLQRQAILNSKN